MHTDFNKWEIDLFCYVQMWTSDMCNARCVCEERENIDSSNPVDSITACCRLEGERVEGQIFGWSGARDIFQ